MDTIFYNMFMKSALLAHALVWQVMGLQSLIASSVLDQWDDIRHLAPEELRASLTDHLGGLLRYMREAGEYDDAFLAFCDDRFKAYIEEQAPALHAFMQATGSNENRISLCAPNPNAIATMRNDPEALMKLRGLF